MSAATEKLITPDNCAFIFIDHQPQMAFGITSIDRQLLKNNVIAMAKTAKLFNIPTVLDHCRNRKLLRLRLAGADGRAAARSS
jgi:hypothetical protein